jgi:hypothetical protein
MKRRTQYFWIDLIVLVTGITCGLALLIATLGAAAGAIGDESAQTTKPTAAPKPSLIAQATSPSATGQLDDAQQTYVGFVTCSTCGAKHSAKLGRSASDCVRICVHTGAQFTLVDGEKTYMLDGDISQLKKVAGQRAQIVGEMRGNTISVSSVVSET